MVQESESVVRVIEKADPTAPHDVLLALGATTDQTTPNKLLMTGHSTIMSPLIMTKLDSTACGTTLVLSRPNSSCQSMSFNPPGARKLLLTPWGWARLAAI